LEVSFIKTFTEFTLESAGEISPAAYANEAISQTTSKTAL
jgi:hypothetical protein